MVTAVKRVPRHPQMAPSHEDIFIGMRMREARVVRGVSQAGLAEKFNISAQQVAKFEIRKNRISAKMLYRLSIMLNRPIEWFVQDLSDEGADMSAMDAKKRFTEKATQYFNRIDDPANQERLLECLKVFAKQKRC